MILRKPYAILIKNFKLIHFILTILMGYLFYKTNMILSFLNEYLASSTTTISKEVANTLYGPILVFVILLVIVATSIILALMKFKDKPIKFYVYNILSHLFLGMIYYVSFQTIRSLEISLIDIRTLKIVHDLLVAIMIAESIGLIISAVRTTGFDIKSFNFKKDLEELDIEDRDNEEFEVELEVDTDRFKRELNRKLRHSKYVYLENKLLINMVALLIIAITCTFVYLYVGVYNKVFKMNTSFKTNEFIFNVTNSFFTNVDYKMNPIFEDKELVVIKLKLRSLYKDDAKLNTAKFHLSIDKKSFYTTIKNRDKLSDLGVVYNNHEIGKEFDTYLLVFEIPKNLSREKMILKYFDTSTDSIRVDVTPIALDEKKEIGSSNFGQKLEFKNSVLGNSSVQITEYELSNSFKLGYQYCMSNNCMEAYEYITPHLGNQKMILLRLKADIIFDKEMMTSKFENPFKLFEYFGRIRYILNDQEKVVYTSLQIEPQKTTTDNYYIEVPEELFNASKIDIEFNIRNKIYIYHVK